jgi:ornithine cyclodeaminase
VSSFTNGVRSTIGLIRSRAASISASVMGRTGGSIDMPLLWTAGVPPANTVAGRRDAAGPYCAMRFIDRDEIHQRLTYDLCIPIVREAMIAFSKGETKQLLRAILPLGDGRLFGSMPGGMGGRGVFGAKLISVFPENFEKGVQSHQGLVVLFDGESGAPICVLHAGEITAIRTAAASAVATDALARKNAARLAILGYGEQARTHARAIAKVRKLDTITVWGRSAERAAAYAREIEAELGVPVIPAPTARACAVDADIICTLTAAKEPILEGKWLRPGAHVNIVGSSYAGPAEVDNGLVARARFIADSREGVLAQGAEFLRAKEAGLVSDDHIVAEIGQVLAGAVEGRQNDEQITAYKSLGHIVQDLAAAAALYSTA